jgi:hypothetical protein
VRARARERERERERESVCVGGEQAELKALITEQIKMERPAEDAMVLW